MFSNIRHEFLNIYCFDTIINESTERSLIKHSSMHLGMKSSAILYLKKNTVIKMKMLFNKKRRVHGYNKFFRRIGL